MTSLQPGQVNIKIAANNDIKHSAISSEMKKMQNNANNKEGFINKNVDEQGTIKLYKESTSKESAAELFGNYATTTGQDTDNGDKV